MEAEGLPRRARIGPDSRRRRIDRDRLDERIGRPEEEESGFQPLGADQGPGSRTPRASGGALGTIVVAVLAV
jgi:hypothetical protein